MGFTLEKDRELPAAVGEKIHGQPVLGVMLTTILSLLIANFVDIDAIAILGSAGFLLILAVVDASAFRLGSQIGANRIVTCASTLACGLSLFALLWDTNQTTPKALWVFGFS